jgi:hypothetical protein
MSGEIRLCRDCRWIEVRVPDDALSAVCLHPTSLRQPRAAVLTGETPPPQPLRCSEARLMGDCGPEGNYLESPTPPRVKA